MSPESAILELVGLAARSPSGHNTQPWTLVRTGEHRLVLRSEASRWLPMVDPANRELMLSFGALIEIIRQAAPAIGYRADVEVLAERAVASDIARIDLTLAPAISSTAPALIRSRATTRTPFLPVGLDSGVLDQIEALDRTAISFVSRESANGRRLADASSEAFAQQTSDDRKQGELAEWLRFSRRDVRERGDGLTPEALGLPKLTQAIWYAAFSRRVALSGSFRRSSINGTRRQLDECAGFLLVTSEDQSVRSLLEAGAVYQRALLRATALEVAHHTMSQALEEDPWRQEIATALGIGGPVQFIVRVGTARHLARPSPRRSAGSLLWNEMG